MGKPTQWCRPTTFPCKKWAYCLSAFLSLPTTTAMPSVGRTIGGSVSIGQGVTAVAAILAGLSAGSFTGSRARRQFLREQAIIEERVRQDNDQMSQEVDRTPEEEELRYPSRPMSSANTKTAKKFNKKTTKLSANEES